jgi:hypothetical protein
MKTITINQFLQAEEIERAVELYRQLADQGVFARTFCDVVIAPNIERINKALGQDNDPMFLAYAVEYVLGKVAEIEEKE